MRQLWADNLGNLSTTYNVEAGKFGLFEIRYSGVAAAAVTVTLANLGNVRLNLNGSDIINLDVEALSLMANNYGGYVEASSVAGGAFAFTIFIPAGYWFDPKNVFYFGKSDKAYYQLQFSALTPAVIDSGNVTIYGNPGKGVQSYIHKILSKQAVSSAASGVITDSIQEKNIISLYLKDPTTLIDNLILIRDGETVVNGSMVSELVYSNWIHQLEAANVLYIGEFVPNKNLAQALSNAFSYQYNFTAAGNLEQYYSAIEFTPDRQTLSMAG